MLLFKPSYRLLFICKAKQNKSVREEERQGGRGEERERGRERQRTACYITETMLERRTVLHYKKNLKQVTCTCKASANQTDPLDLKLFQLRSNSSSVVLSDMADLNSRAPSSSKLLLPSNRIFNSLLFWKERHRW